MSPCTRPNCQSRLDTGQARGGGPSCTSTTLGRPRTIRNTWPGQPSVPASLRPGLGQLTHRAETGRDPPGLPAPTRLSAPRHALRAQALRHPAQCACLLSFEAHASTPGLVHGRWAPQAVGQGCSQVSGPSTPVAWVSGLPRVPVSIQSWRWQHAAGGQALGLLSLWRTAKGADPTACLQSSGLGVQALVTPCC